jgi:hypothetical protein
MIKGFLRRKLLLKREIENLLHGSNPIKQMLKEET